MLLLFSLFIFKSFGQFTKTITITTSTTNDTNTTTTVTDTNNIQTRSTRIYSDPNKGACMCDLIINICDSQCCCDSRCSDTLISEWTTNSQCLNEASLQNYYYPECSNLVDYENNFDSKYHINQINDIMCSAVQRLPYAGVYANIEDLQTLTTVQNSFDQTENLLFTLYQNPQNIAATIKQYSGNPGYIKGKPLMMGKFSAANMNLFWVQQFKIFAWTKDGYCSTKDNYNSAIYKIINFGEDLVITCAIPTTDTNYCNSSFTYEITTAFIDDGGTNYYYVGKWGSSNNNRTLEWIQINKTADNFTGVTQTCARPFYQQLTIYYQKVGITGDLQNTIISVNLTDVPLQFTAPKQLTLKVKYIELIQSEIDPNSQKSFQDTITPYVKKIFQPFSLSRLFTFGIFIYIILQ